MRAVIVFLGGWGGEARHPATPGRRAGASWTAPPPPLPIIRPRLLARCLGVALVFAAGCGPIGPGVDPLDVLERHATEGAARARESVVALEYSAADTPAGARRIASGVVVSDEGEVLSVRIDPPTPGALPIVARLANGRRLPATWVAADHLTGLTLLRITPGVARRAVPADREPLPGLPLLLIGNPFGLGHSVSRGYVAGTGRRVLYGNDRLGGLIQVGAGLHPGDSGALVADLRGGWLGLIRSGMASPLAEKPRDRDSDRDAPRSQAAGLGHDLGFAIPARDALWVAGQLRTHGRIDRAFLGVVTNPLTVPSESAGPAGTGTRAEGVELKDVIAGSPAALGGLRPGDRIIALGGEKVSGPLDLTDILDRTAAGDALTVDYMRHGEAETPRSTATTTPLRQILLTSRRPPITPGASPPVDAVAEPPPSAPSPSRPGPKPVGNDPAEAIARLERRIRDLERAALPRESDPGVARKP